MATADAYRWLAEARDAGAANRASEPRLYATASLASWAQVASLAENAFQRPVEARHPRLVHWGGFALAVLLCVLILGLLKLLATIGA